MTERRRIWAFERGTLWANDPGAAPHAPVVPRRAVAYHEVHPEDAPPLAEAMGERDRTVVEGRFAGARRCFAAWDGGRIAAYGWASQGHEYVGEMERTFRLQTGEAYIWDCATLPEYRGQRLYSALLDYMVAELRRAGVGRELMRRAESEAVARGCRGSYVDTFHFQARGFYEKLGYAIFGRLDDMPSGGARYYLSKNLVP